MAAKSKNTSLQPSQQGPNIAFQRVELTNLLEQYNIIKDCIGGSFKVKKQKSKYLPVPNAEDNASEKDPRYLSYLTRAVFYNVTKRTLAGLLGQIFMRDPVIEVPPLMDNLKLNIRGDGTSLDQMAFLTAGSILGYGRAGLLIDYPDTDIPATAEDIQKGRIQPCILLFESWDIINWRTVFKNGKEVLSLVVIFELTIEEDDGFEQKFKDQYRVLSINADGIYQVDLYEKTSSNFTISETYFPKDAKGINLTEIPFTFVGVYSNNSNIDEPPIIDLVELNIAHYRNSADYEEACFLVGQPTPVLIGLTEDWVKNILKEKVSLGSRTAIPLPPGADAKLLQAAENSMVKEAMDQKERQMVALGAKLVEQKSVQRTLGEAELENTAETSILSSIAKNVETAMVFALTWCARFIGADETQIKYELNTEFDLTQLDFNERAETIAEWQAGAISFSEMRQNLRRGGIATMDVDAVKAELKQDKTDGVGPPVPPAPANGPNGIKKPVAAKPAAA